MAVADTGDVVVDTGTGPYIAQTGIEPAPVPRTDSVYRAMTIDECISVVESFEFHGGLKLWHPKLVARRQSRAGLEIGFSFLVPDKATGRDAVISTTATWALEEINASMIPFQSRVLDLVRGLFEHEMHEGLFVAGQQVVDPHEDF